MPLRFSADFSNPDLDIDPLIDEVFGELKSGFLELPRGEGFIEYPVFETGYQALKRATKGFTAISAELIVSAVYNVPIAFVVLRTIFGLHSLGVGRSHLGTQ